MPASLGLPTSASPREACIEPTDIVGAGGVHLDLWAARVYPLDDEKGRARAAAGRERMEKTDRGRVRRRVWRDDGMDSDVGARALDEKRRRPRRGFGRGATGLTSEPYPESSFADREPFGG